MLNRDPNRLPAISPELLRADQIARTIARRLIARPPRAIANDASDEAMLADVEHFDARTGALLHSLEAEVADLDARGCDHQNMIQNNHTDRSCSARHNTCTGVHASAWHLADTGLLVSRILLLCY